MKAVERRTAKSTAKNVYFFAANSASTASLMAREG
jgi:hypothetical protein